MEWVCGVFSSSDAAAWVEAIGTVAAAIVAVVIYNREHRARRKDVQSRRSLLHSVLRERVSLSAKSAEAIAEKLSQLRDETDLFEWRKVQPWIVVVSIARLTELQSQLLQIGESEDAEVGAFIESCRLYVERLDYIIQFVSAARFGPRDEFRLDTADLRERGLTMVRMAGPARDIVLRSSSVPGLPVEAK